jgi:peptidylprolyl isomerase
MLSNARLLRAAGFFALAVVLAGPALAAGNPENTLVMTLKCGEVVIDLRPDLAPKHVAQIKKLTRQGF